MCDVKKIEIIIREKIEGKLDLFNEKMDNLKTIMETKFVQNEKEHCNTGGNLKDIESKISSLASKEETKQLADRVKKIEDWRSHFSGMLYIIGTLLLLILGGVVSIIVNKF